WRTCATASALACDPGPPRMAWVGSPPAARSAKKTRVATTQATRTAAARRPASHRSTPTDASAGQLRIDEGGGGHGAQCPYSAHPGGDEVVLLVVQRQDVVALQDYLLRLHVEFLALVRIGDGGGLLQNRIQLRDPHLGVVSEVAAGGRLGARGVVEQPQHIGPDLGVGGTDGGIGIVTAVCRGGQGDLPGAKGGRVRHDVAA